MNEKDEQTMKQRREKRMELEFARAEVNQELLDKLKHKIYNKNESELDQFIEVSDLKTHPCFEITGSVIHDSIYRNVVKKETEEEEMIRHGKQIKHGIKPIILFNEDKLRMNENNASIKELEKNKYKTFKFLLSKLKRIVKDDELFFTEKIYSLWFNINIYFRKSYYFDFKEEYEKNVGKFNMTDLFIDRIFNDYSQYRIRRNIKRKFIARAKQLKEESNKFLKSSKKF